MDHKVMQPILSDLQTARFRAPKGYICKRCGRKVTRYGPETFHTVSTFIFCQFGGTKAEAVLEEDT